MDKRKNILISPLNWGLGHASRLIPIIKYLKESEHNIIIGGSGASIDILQKRFPDLKYVYISSPTLIYGKRKSFSTIFYLSFIKFAINVFREHFVLKKLISQNNIDIVISDNRLGLYNKKIKSIYVSHQLNIYLTTGQKNKSFLATYAHRNYIKKYDHCWIPDIKSSEMSLTGRLTENANDLKVEFLGPVSRFEKQSFFDISEAIYDFICILSGPEPQRTMFERILIDIFSNSAYNVVILRGLPDCSEKLADTANIKFLNHSDDEELINHINVSRRIICRSGYSTIMDLVNIGRRAILVSTPEQPEQEYLASRLSLKHGFVKINQNDLKNTDFTSIKYDELWNFGNDLDNIGKIIDSHIG
ncbi:MAG: hypothetical protein LBQ22_03995 [Bacteroidales bacterium]|nr:hypothetical protein [Bacteroidales bacterium]